MTLIFSNENRILFNRENADHLLELNYGNRFISLLDEYVLRDCTYKSSHKHKSLICEKICVCKHFALLDGRFTPEVYSKGNVSKKLDFFSLPFEYTSGVKRGYTVHLWCRGVKCNNATTKSFESKQNQTQKEEVNPWTCKTYMQRTKLQNVCKYKFWIYNKRPNLKTSFFSPVALYTSTPEVYGVTTCIKEAKIFDERKVQKPKINQTSQSPIDRCIEKIQFVLRLKKSKNKNFDSLFSTENLFLYTYSVSKSFILNSKKICTIFVTRKWLDCCTSLQSANKMNSPYFILKEKTDKLKVIVPKMSIGNFAFGSSFLLIIVTSLLQRQNQNSWHFSFLKRQIPGVCIGYQENSWECFENITSQYLNNNAKSLFREKRFVGSLLDGQISSTALYTSTPEVSPEVSPEVYGVTTGKQIDDLRFFPSFVFIKPKQNLLKNIHFQKDQLYIDFSEPWNLQLIKNFTGIISRVPALKNKWMVQPFYELHAKTPCYHVCNSRNVVNGELTFKNQVLNENDTIPSKMSCSTNTVFADNYKIRNQFDLLSFAKTKAKCTDLVLAKRDKNVKKQNKNENLLDLEFTYGMSPEFAFKKCKTSEKLKKIERRNDILKKFFYEYGCFSVPTKALSKGLLNQNAHSKGDFDFITSDTKEQDLQDFVSSLDLYSSAKQNSFARENNVALSDKKQELHGQRTFYIRKILDDFNFSNKIDLQSKFSSARTFCTVPHLCKVQRNVEKYPLYKFQIHENDSWNRSMTTPIEKVSSYVLYKTFTMNSRLMSGYKSAEIKDLQTPGKNKVYIKIPPALPFYNTKFSSFLREIVSQPIQNSVARTNLLTSTNQKFVRRFGFVKRDVSPLHPRRGCTIARPCKVQIREKSKKDKKLPYKQFSLNEFQEIKPLFEKVIDKEIRISPNKIAFKKPLFSDYNDYLNRPKDSLAAISISPSLEEDHAINQSWNEHIEREALVNQNLEKSKSLKKNLTDVIPLEEDIASRLQINEPQKKAHLDHTHLESEALNDSRFEEASNKDEKEENEEEKKKEITKWEWLHNVREAELDVEKRKDFQKLAYPNKEALLNKRLLSFSTFLPMHEYAPKMHEIGIKNCDLAKQKILVFRKIPNLLVSDRKSSFFGITNIFPKRLIAEDQRQINNQILREEGDSYQIEDNDVLRLENQGNPFDHLNDHLNERTCKTEGQKGHAEAKNEKQEWSTIPIKKAGLANKNKQNQELLSSLRIIPRVANFLPIMTPYTSGVKVYSKCKVQQHPVYTPSRRLRLRLAESSKLSQNNNPQSRIDFLNLCQSHRWWQKRRVTSSLLGAPSKRYMVMPEIKRADWRKIIEWQLKTYFLEEEKRLQPFLCSASNLPSIQSSQELKSVETSNAPTRYDEDGKQIDRFANNGNVPFTPSVDSLPFEYTSGVKDVKCNSAKSNKQNFKIKKVAIYLPWLTLKKPLKKPFEWPLTRLSYKSQKQVENTRTKLPFHLYANANIASNSTVPFTFSVDSLPHKHKSKICEKICACTLPQKCNHVLTSTSTNLLTNLRFVLVKRFVRRFGRFTPEVYSKCKNEVFLNKKLDSCLVSSLSPQFKALPLPFNLNQYTLHSCTGAHTSKVQSAKPTTIHHFDKLKTLPLYTKGVKCNSGANQFMIADFAETKLKKAKDNLAKTKIYKLFIFEMITKDSHLLFHQLLLIIALKQVLQKIYRLFGKIIVDTVKNSSLGIALLPFFLNAYSRKNQISTLYHLKKRLKDLVGSEDTVASLSEIVWYLRNSCRGRLVPRGVVLVETHNSDSIEFLKAVGGEAQVPVIVESLRALPLTQNHPQRRLEKILKFAEKRAPCILFLDDLDAIGKVRTLLINKDKDNARISLASCMDMQTNQLPNILRYRDNLSRSNDLKTKFSELKFGFSKTLEKEKWKKYKNDFYKYKCKSNICKKIGFAEAPVYVRFAIANAKLTEKNFQVHSVLRTHTDFLKNSESQKAHTFLLNDFLVNKGFGDTNVRSNNSWSSKQRFHNINLRFTRSRKTTTSFLHRRENPFQSNSNKVVENSVENSKGEFHSSVPETEKVIEQRRLDLMLRLLTVMDGISNLKGVLIVTTSQNPSSLDPALLRPGRFERFINLKAPNKKRRIELLKMHTAKIGHTFSMPWEYLGEKTENMSGAAISDAINHSAFRSIIKSTVHTLSTLEDGINRVSSSNSNAQKGEVFPNTKKSLSFALGKKDKPKNLVSKFFFRKSEGNIRTNPNRRFSQTSIRFAQPKHRFVLSFQNKKKITGCCTVAPYTSTPEVYGVTTGFKVQQGLYVQGANHFGKTEINHTNQKRNGLKNSVLGFIFDQAGKGVVQSLLFPNKKKDTTINTFEHFDLRNIAFAQNILQLYAGSASESLYLNDVAYKSKNEVFRFVHEDLRSHNPKTKRTCVKNQALLHLARMCHARTNVSMWLHQKYKVQQCNKYTSGVKRTVPLRAKNSRFKNFVFRYNFSSLGLGLALIKQTNNAFPQLYNERNQDYWLEDKTCQTLKIFKRSTGNWYRLYLPKLEQNKSNREWHIPDIFSNQHIFMHLKSIDQKPIEMKNVNLIHRNLSLQERSSTPKKTIFNNHFSDYNMVLSCFYISFQNLNENRELLDLLADHLIRFQFLRSHEIIRISSFYVDAN